VEGIHITRSRGHHPDGISTVSVPPLTASTKSAHWLERTLQGKVREERKTLSTGWGRSATLFSPQLLGVRLFPKREILSCPFHPNGKHRFAEFCLEWRCPKKHLLILGEDSGHLLRRLGKRLKRSLDGEAGNKKPSLRTIKTGLSGLPSAVSTSKTSEKLARAGFLTRGSPY
jgi:hypothetical protein